MSKQITITISDEVYHGLSSVVGKQRISHFIENIIRPYVVYSDIEQGYQMMAQDEEHEKEAILWSEALIGDVGDEAW